jgi:uncharacterized membrane-anchored protein YhcB (DUF1043 family)
MFGIGPAEILLIVIVALLLLAALVIGVVIIYLIFKSLSGNQERRLEARIDDLEKRLQEQQKK